MRNGKGCRGGEVYDEPGVRDRYLRHRHSGTASPNVVMEEPHLLAVLGGLHGAAVLDLGCGDGSSASLTLDLGAASYIGVDGSAAMIDAAQASQDDPRAKFVHASIEELALPPASFDLVMSRMALHYVEHLAPVLFMIRRLLRPGGRFVFSVTHPVITSYLPVQTGPRTDWTVDDYFVRGPRERPWFGTTVTWHHRTVEDYFVAINDVGLRVKHLRECEPAAELLVANSSELARRRRVPLILLLSAVAPDDDTIAGQAQQQWE